MTERVQGPAYYFPSIEKRYGQPISYWLDLIGSSELTKHKALGHLRCHVFDVSPECDGG